MPLCIDTYTEKRVVVDENTLVRMCICQIYMVGEGQRVPSGEPGLFRYVVSQKNATTLKNAYVKLGSVPLGWFYTTPQQGIFIETLPLPVPFRWSVTWPLLEHLVDNDVSSVIMKEFGIPIDRYLL